jgi:hypothetical protein
MFFLFILLIDLLWKFFIAILPTVCSIFYFSILFLFVKLFPLESKTYINLRKKIYYVFFRAGSLTIRIGSSPP